MEQEVIISVENLTKYYGKSVGTKNISFRVFKGEIFGFLGPNGAGKTTTIRMLLDLLRPTSGEIFIFGSNIRNRSFETRKQLGYLPGEFAAYNHLSGLEYLMLVSKIRETTYNAHPGLCRRLGLSEKDLGKKTRALSHGTLQKLGIVQALAHQPRLLILDEPTTGLDPLMKEVFYQILKEEQQKGTTIFFSSHNLVEVEKLCNRVAIIRNGEIAGLESLDRLKEKAGQILRFTLNNSMDMPEIPGTVLLEHWDNHFTYRFTGNVNRLLQCLSGLDIRDFSLGKPGLEELFAGFYHENAQQ